MELFFNEANVTLLSV